MLSQLNLNNFVAPDPLKIRAELAKRSLYNFIIQTWYKKTDPFIDSWHIRDICSRMDQAIKRFRNGESSYIILTLPPRHSKSQIVSRAFPAYFKGIFQESEIIVTSYASNLVTKFSKDTRDKIVQGEVFKAMYPDLRISRNSASVTEWGFEKQYDNDWKELEGGFQYAGILGGLTGKGYHLGIADDLLKGREEAESETIRVKVWDEFIDSFLTRSAPVSITIIIQTRWHIDDITGRIKNRMNRNHPDYDRNFPRFELINYPAEDNKYKKQPGNKKSKYLFINRYNEDWYKARKSTMSEYAYASLMMCDPVLKGGNIFKVDNIQKIPMIGFPINLKWIRAWDLASSEKERINNDPDYTVGVLMAVTTERIKNIPLRKIYIRDMIRIRAEATARNKIIIDTAVKDGEDVNVAVEAYGSYKDAYTQIKDLLLGIRIVHKVTTSGDKLVRATPQESIIESKNFYILDANWNKDLIKEYTNFPSGDHDDIVDSVSTGYHCITKVAIIK